MKQSEDNIFMKRCLELAIRAEGMTYPNPMVGSVIVHEGKIVGEGYHIKAGGHHAEVNAINSVSDKDQLRDSTLYVNLEPCSHFGKTPPCADFIVANGIPRVVIGSLDTSDKVSGEGVQILRRAGCEVTTGVLDMESRMLNRRFFTFNEKKRPYITLKWAQSSDGYLDMIRSEDNGHGANWITGNPERVLVHKWRASEQAILAGAGTFRTDDPKLNVREWSGPQPLRIILSSSGNIVRDFSADGTNSRVVVFTHNKVAEYQGAIKSVLNEEMPSSSQIVQYLFNSGIQSLFIEGGAQVLNHFISTGIWDEMRIFTGNQFFREGLKAPEISGTLMSKQFFSSSTLEIYLREGS